MIFSYLFEHQIPSLIPDDVRKIRAEELRAAGFMGGFQTQLRASRNRMREEHTMLIGNMSKNAHITFCKFGDVPRRSGE
jgi:hypothetical protein